MKNKKLNAVTNKICELLKGTDLDPMYPLIGCYIETEMCGFIVTGIDEIDCMYGTDTEGHHEWAYAHTKGFLNYGRPIREAEVLAALHFNPNSFNSRTEMGVDGVLKTETLSEKFWIKWQLGHPLSNQPTEVIDFLFNVLNCE